MSRRSRRRRRGAGVRAPVPRSVPRAVCCGGGHGCDYVPARDADGVPELPHHFARGAGDRVLALWGHKWFPGDVYAVKDGGSAYEIAWDDEDASNEIPASRVRAAPLTVDVDAPTARDARPPALVTPQAASSQTTVVDVTRRGTI